MFKKEKNYEKDGFMTVCMKLVKCLQMPYYNGSAAEMGFYFIFSIVPIVTILTQLLGYLGISGVLSQVVQVSLSNEGFLSDLLGSFERTLPSGVNIAFMFGALFAASKIEFSLMRISNYTYSIRQPGNQFTGYFKIRAKAMLLVTILILIVLTSLLVLVYGKTILGLLTTALDKYFGIELQIENAYLLLRWPILFFVYFFIIAINYRLLIPIKGLKLRYMFPGSIFASVGIVVASLAYQLYFSYFSNLNLIYGSLATIIALLLWFFWLSYIMLVGLLLNSVCRENDPNGPMQLVRESEFFDPTIRY